MRIYPNQTHPEFSVPELVLGEKFFIQVETDRGWRTDDLCGITGEDATARGFISRELGRSIVARHGRPGWKYRIVHLLVEADDPFINTGKDEGAARG